LARPAFGVSSGICFSASLIPVMMLPSYCFHFSCQGLSLLARKMKKPTTPAQMMA